MNTIDQVEVKNYYDLDGTLSSLNSTFDFIEAYLKYKKKPHRIFLAKAVNKVLRVTGYYDPYKHRSVRINILFRGLKKSHLEDYYEKIYKKRFLNSLTPLGKELLHKALATDVLITGCTEIPAKKIGELFNFKSVISTEFNYAKGKVVGIKTDTFGNLKRKYVSRCGEKMIYYTDDLPSEKHLVDIMDEIVEV
ncbi:HAD family hydrolase [Zunongwangia sp. F260]|uniref:HAD family hydrolase n=1 Tax=Autumnicola lenta TaxID=3075593 RepID=A0ABU3CJ74_9FLAO|nr:HAD family hydrolase [Zunongwangia sp. F260]MDT0646272.1 HAD family hydrolase [Zunongwangia sp. F260]